jgi:hypothetical protein
MENIAKIISEIPQENYENIFKPFTTKGVIRLFNLLEYFYNNENVW